MSGGRYNDLFNIHDRPLQHLADQRADLQAMATRLTELDDAGAAAEETFRLLTDLAALEQDAAARVERLREVWRAVEWQDSGDGHPDQTREALAAYRAANAASTVQPTDECSADAQTMAVAPPSTVYVATSGEYSDYRVQAVFAREEDARSFGLADDFLELEVNEGPVEVSCWWSLIWHPQGQRGSDPQIYPEQRLFDGDLGNLRHEWGKTHLHVPFLRVEGWDRDGVLKVYSEQRAQYLVRCDLEREAAIAANMRATGEDGTEPCTPPS